jgi:hypothetical protein
MWSSNSSNNIATVGSHQYVYGSSQDAFLAKFDSSGIRIWATYYGGIGEDAAQAVCTDTAAEFIYRGTQIAAVVLQHQVAISHFTVGAVAPHSLLNSTVLVCGSGPHIMVVMTYLLWTIINQLFAMIPVMYIWQGPPFV